MARSDAEALIAPCAAAPHDAAPSHPFECNICMDVAGDPVVTLCGHLYCWQCIYTWSAGHSETCPVCKAPIPKSAIVPIYGRGRPQFDPRSHPMPADLIPKRPAGQGGPPQPHRGFAGEVDPLLFLTAMPPDGPPRRHRRQSSEGLAGLVPSLFGLRQHLVAPGTEFEEAGSHAASTQQIFLSRVLLIIGCLVILLLLLF